MSAAVLADTVTDAVLLQLFPYWSSIITANDVAPHDAEFRTAVAAVLCAMNLSYWLAGAAPRDVLRMILAGTLGSTYGIAQTLDDLPAARDRADRAFKAVGRFSVEAMVAQYESIYREIVGHD